MSLAYPFLLMVVMGDAIVKVLSLTAIPIVLSPKSRPKSVSDVLSFSINSLGLLTKVYKLKIDKNTTLKIAKLSRIKIEDDEVDEEIKYVPPPRQGTLITLYLCSFLLVNSFVHPLVL